MKKKLWASYSIIMLLLLCPHYSTTISNSSWRSIQRKIKDTVVQIFAFTFEKNIIEPYMTPHQQPGRGSGFFIRYEDSIFIVTNAHVVNQAVGIYIHIPSLGQKPIRCELVSICPDRDLALLKIIDEELEYVRKGLGGSIPYLMLGDSNTVCRAEEVLALGYPLGQESLKSTTGVVSSGCEQQFIQIDAPINPGSSGGPLIRICLDDEHNAEVIGINSEGIFGAQNIGYSIPINHLKIILPQMMCEKLVKKPSLGIVISNASYLADYFGNPIPSGAYIAEVIKESPLDKAGIKQGDMLYEIDGYSVDEQGNVLVPWSEDRISIINYIASIGIKDSIHIIVYRAGKRIAATVSFRDSFDTVIRHTHLGYEPFDYEIFAGMVVTPLTLNHIKLMKQHVPGLQEYAGLKKQDKPALLVTHVFPTSVLYLTHTIGCGIIITHINNKEVRTLYDFRKAIKEAIKKDFILIRGIDTVDCLTDNLCVALKTNDVLSQEASLAEQYGYTLSPMVQSLLES